jgi:hypothetical protein
VYVFRLIESESGRERSMIERERRKGKSVRVSEESSF